MHEPLMSVQNPRIKEALKLNNRRDRNQTGLFLVEGYREVLRASQNGVQIETLFICPARFLGCHEGELIASVRQRGTRVVECVPALFDKLSYRDRPDGILAVAEQMRHSLSLLDERLKGVLSPFLVVAEAIEKPGNLGTILRSADAAGAHGVIVCDRCTDIYNPNVVRASVGTLFTLPVIEASSEEVLPWLRKQGIALIAATPSAQALFTDTPLTGPVAIAVGTEQLGLSPVWMQAADICVRIPMLGVADSLNVATATTLLLYEAVRQRTQSENCIHR